jgi:hypothetical protein
MMNNGFSNEAVEWVYLSCTLALAATINQSSAGDRHKMIKACGMLHS